MRHNGLEKPYNWMQVSTWIILPTLLLQFFFFASPLLPLAASIPCSIVVFFFGALTAYKAIKTTITDPADSHSQKKTQGANFTDEEKAEEEARHCHHCESNVNNNAVHCNICHKCIEGYDHHCKWLNNCIGKKNYQLFFDTLVSLSLFLFSQSAVLIGIIVAFFVGWDDGQTSSTEQRAIDWFGANQPNVVIGFNLGFWAFDTIAEALILQLLFFHLSLRKKGMTTYQFIVKDNEKKRMESRKQMDTKRRRADHMKREIEEGNIFGRMALTVGGWKGCGCIDPITNGSVDDTSSPDGSMPDASINRDVIGSSSLDSWNYMLLQGSAVHG
mmetsp:Transcript_13124/g.19570  ORF Transcript_13124/g.19570 Transcript_13124/m.19570 type:complete len:329 (-) Transcript_13124:60-1046(-)